MEVFFLGVGEACDPDRGNTAIVVRAGTGPERRQVLLDCGFTAAHAYFGRFSAPELDGLWISHFHGDHFFGVPLLLLRLREEGRTRPLVILGPPGGRERIIAAMELAYPSFGAGFAFPVEYNEMEGGATVTAAGFAWQAARSDHSDSAPGLAVRLEGSGKSLFYSGDGRPTAETQRLASGCDLVIHESFRFQGDTPGHGSVAGSLEFARQARAARLALVHIQREERQRYSRELANMAAEINDLELLVPEPGQKIIL
ncbi:MAG: MBL fold metallo-hydrolase [Desulfobacterales bacterium]|nr:MBL fold metallo-hydrolase [Desulfobacterales bacterium]